MYLPKNDVRYPPSCIQVAIVEFSWPRKRNFWKPTRGGSLLSTWWLCTYWPRRVVARLGQHRELVTKAFSKVVPPSIISSRRLGMYFRSPTAASSVRIRTTFGCSGSSSRGSGGCWPWAGGRRPPALYGGSPAAASSVRIRTTFGCSGSSSRGSGGCWPWAVGRQPTSRQASRRSKAFRPAPGRTLPDLSPPRTNLSPTRSVWGRELTVVIPCGGSARAPRAPEPRQARKLCYTFWRCASPLAQDLYWGGRGRRRGGRRVLYDLIRAVPVALLVGLVPGYFWARCLAATGDLAERLAYAIALSVTLVPVVALILSSLLGTGVTSTVSVISVALVFFAGLAARLVFGSAKGQADPIAPLPPAPGVVTLVPLCLALLLALGTFFGLLRADRKSGVE